MYTLSAQRQEVADRGRERERKGEKGRKREGERGRERERERGTEKEVEGERNQLVLQCLPKCRVNASGTKLPQFRNGRQIESNHRPIDRYCDHRTHGVNIPII